MEKITIWYRVYEISDLVVYIYNSKNTLLKAFRFKTREEISEYLEKAEKNHQAKDNFRKEKQKARTDLKNKYLEDLKVWDIIVHSWWYEQTNVDFYRITRKDENKIFLVKNLRDLEYDSSMSGECWPIDELSDAPGEWHKITSDIIKVEFWIVRLHEEWKKYFWSSRA